MRRRQSADDPPSDWLFGSSADENLTHQPKDQAGQARNLAAALRGLVVPSVGKQFRLCLMELQRICPRVSMRSAPISLFIARRRGLPAPRASEGPPDFRSSSASRKRDRASTGAAPIAVPEAHTGSEQNDAWLEVDHQG